MTENKNICFDSEDIEVEKVTELELIFRMIGERPYYEIKYKKVGEDFYHIGYSSYDAETVLMYKEKYFEIVEGKETNADRIRSMTDEELAKFLARCDCLETPYCPLPIHCHEEVRNHETCAKAFLRYLQSESEVEKMRKTCGNCKYNEPDPLCKEEDFMCGNEDSENYGINTDLDDGCEDFEGKEEE